MNINTKNNLPHPHPVSTRQLLTREISTLSCSNLFAQLLVLPHIRNNGANITIALSVDISQYRNIDAHQAYFLVLIVLASFLAYVFDKDQYSLDVQPLQILIEMMDYSG